MTSSWKELNFEECIQKISNSKKVPKKNFLSSGKIPIISQENKFINGYWDISDDAILVTKAIVIFGDHTQRVKYVDFNFVIGADGVKVLLPINEINSRFFYYKILSLEIRKLGYARHYRILKEQRISFPLLNEQKQIVAILDKSFEAIDKAQVNIEQNIQNANDLFQAKLNEIFSQKSDDWEEYKLGEIVALEYGKPLPQEDRDPEGLYAVYGANGIKNRSNKSYINKKSLIIGRKGSAGEINYTEDNFWPLDVTYYTEFNREVLELDFLYYLLIMQNIPSLAKGVKPGINRNDVYALDVTIPNISIQKEIVLVLNQFSSQLYKLENQYKSGIDHLKELKKSILQKAFSGELIK